MNTGLLLFKRSSHHHRRLDDGGADVDEKGDHAPLKGNTQEILSSSRRQTSGEAIQTNIVNTDKGKNVAAGLSENSSGEGGGGPTYLNDGSGNIDAAWDLETAYGPASSRSLATSARSVGKPPSLLNMVSAPATSTGKFHRTNDGLDKEDDNLSEESPYEEESIASFGQDFAVSPKTATSPSSRFPPPARSKSNDTMLQLFTKSLQSKPTPAEHRSPKATQDDASREHSDPTTFTGSLNDSMTFASAPFPGPNDQNSSSQDDWDRSPMKSNSSGNFAKSFNFVKSPFSSPTTTSNNTSSGSLRHHLGKRPGIDRQTSQRSTDTKSTIEGGASCEIERQRAILDKELQATLRTSKSSAGIPQLPSGQSPPHRKSPTPQQIPQAPSMSDNDSTPLTSPSSRKSYHPSNPVSGGGKWGKDLNELSNMLLAKKEAWSSMAEDDEASPPYGPSTPSQSRRSLAGKTERRTSASPSPRRNGLRTTRTSRSGSRRNLIPEDPVRSAEKRSHQRQRSQSPHGLAAAAAAAQARRSRRSPSVVRSSSRRRTSTSNSTRSPSPSEKAKSSPGSAQASSPNHQTLQSLLTPEKIIEHIRAGNFNLELDQSIADFSGVSANTTGRITLKLKATGDLNVSNQSAHSKISHRSEPSVQARISRKSSSGSTTRYDRQASSGSLNNPKSRSSYLSSSGGDVENDVQPPPPPISSPSKSPRRGRRKQVSVENEILANNDETRSRSPSSRRRSSDANYHRSPSGLRDRTVVPSTPVPEDEQSRRKGRRRVDSNTTSEAKNHHRSSSDGHYHRSPSGLRDRIVSPSPEEDQAVRNGRKKPGPTSTSGTTSHEKEDHRGASLSASPRKTTRRDQTNPSRRARSRSRDAKSRLRRGDSSSGQVSEDHQPQFVDNTSEMDGFVMPIQVRPTVDDAPDAPLRSTRNLKEPSLARRQERKQATPMTMMIRKASPTSRSDRPVVVSSPSGGRTTPSSVPRTTNPAIVVSPIVVTKENATVRQTSPGTSRRRERNLFSSDWAHDVNSDDWVNGGGGTDSDENPKHSTKERQRKAQSSRNLF